MRHALLPGDPADERDVRAAQVDAEALEHRGVRVGPVEVGVDAVVDDVQPALVEGGVAAQDVRAHPVADCDDRVGGLVGGALRPRADPVAAAELLGLPRALRLEAVRGDDVRDVLEQLRQVAGHVGVPRVRVQHVDVGTGVDRRRHRDVGGEHLERGVRTGEPLLLLGVRHRAVPRLAHAVHVDVDQLAELTDQEVDVHAGSAVHVGRELAGEDGCAHGTNLVDRATEAIGSTPTGVGSTDGRSAAHAEGVGDRPRRRRGQAADAADARPRQAGCPVRRQLPADRLRPVEPRQRRLPAVRGADAVQVALARPAHLGHLADVDAARQLRHAGAGPAAPRSAVVPRQRRRDLPVDEPHQRRPARHHRGVRRGPRLPDGRLADGAGAHRHGRRRDRRRHPGAAQGRLPVRRHQGCRRRRHDRGVPREAGGPARSRRLPRRGVRVDGQLRLQHRGARRRAREGRRRPELAPRHGRRHHPDDGRAAAGERLRLQGQHRARRHDP